MRVSYSPEYCIPLPERHPFPMRKFPALHGLLLGEGLLRAADVVEPRVAEWGDLVLVHTPAYLNALAAGTQTKAEVRRMGLPWSERLVRRSRIAVQGTINAALMALEDGIAANLAGGTHHAMPGHGEGFCVLNDVAVAIRTLHRAGWLRRACVIDLDVHQGNGTAHVFAEAPHVTTFSMHGAKNFPFRKPPSTLDVGLPDGTGDAEYLAALRTHLPNVLGRADADLVFYLAGVDVREGDRYGRLSLTRAGMFERDATVIEAVCARDTPLVLLLSGGYAETPEATADLHAITHRAAASVL